MTDHEPIFDPLDEHLDPLDRELADLLERRRPVPPAGFRGALGRCLAAADPGFGPRPAWLRARVAVLTAAGSMLIALGLLQATGPL